MHVIQTHMDFTAFKKDSGKINRNILFEIFQNDQAPNHLIKAMRNIYKKNLIAVDVGGDYSECKSVNQGVHEGCSLYLIIYHIYEWHDQKMVT